MLVKTPAFRWRYRIENCASDMFETIGRRQHPGCRISPRKKPGEKASYLKDQLGKSNGFGWMNLYVRRGV